jgi:4-hydroxy-tetrahydrodipicolinate reductase
MTDIIIQGIGGRMGHVLCEMIAQREDCRVVAGIDMKDGEINGIPVYDSLDKGRRRHRLQRSGSGREGAALL